MFKISCLVLTLSTFLCQLSTAPLNEFDDDDRVDSVAVPAPTSSLPAFPGTLATVESTTFPALEPSVYADRFPDSILDYLQFSG